MHNNIYSILQVTNDIFESEPPPLPHHHASHNFHRDRRMSIREYAARAQRNSLKANGLPRRGSHRGSTRSRGCSRRLNRTLLCHEDIKQIRSTSSHKYHSWLYKMWQCIIGNQQYRDSMMRSSPQGTNSVSKIDTASKIIFPLSFVSFHIFYWYSYLGTTSDTNGMLI